jgi:hypothetical protein
MEPPGESTGRWLLSSWLGAGAAERIALDADTVLRPQRQGRRVHSYTEVGRLAGQLTAAWDASAYAERPG